jgi:hypothetical protein
MGEMRRAIAREQDERRTQAELTALARNLDPHFDKFYREAQQCRAVAGQGAKLKGSQTP